MDSFHEHIQNAAAGTEEVASSIQEIAGSAQRASMVASEAVQLSSGTTDRFAALNESGKGFAVVASEVKELAEQTAKATDEIRHRIADIQSQTGSAGESIHAVGEIIASIRDIQNQIAASVEQQAATMSAQLDAIVRRFRFS